MSTADIALPPGHHDPLAADAAAEEPQASTGEMSIAGIPPCCRPSTTATSPHQPPPRKAGAQ